MHQRESCLRKVIASYTLDDWKSTHYLEYQKANLQWDTVAWTWQRHWQASFPALQNGQVLRYRVYGTLPNGKKIYADNQATSVKKPRNMLFGQTRTPPLRRNGPKPRVFIKSLWTGSTVAIISPGCKPKTFMAYLVATYGGITEKLDTIHDLGFNTLWLTPIFKTPPSSHGYDTTDYETIDPALAQKMT